jgi:malate dehydrogenase (oxaloacetate-decarboxylating)
VIATGRSDYVAAAIPPDELSADYIVPSVFNRCVAPAVAAAVASAARAAGLARRFSSSPNAASAARPMAAAGSAPTMVP